eukprot:5975912-Pyramimonas_sp.AAC.1
MPSIADRPGDPGGQQVAEGRATLVKVWGSQTPATPSQLRPVSGVLTSSWPPTLAFKNSSRAQTTAGDPQGGYIWVLAEL